jgi:drug/metabolite transporter (DMT)-like permease
VRVLAVVIALVAAACFALTSAVQQRAAKQERPHRTLDPRLLLRLARRPLWLASWVPDLAGTGLQTVALRFAPLTLVQPLLASGLFLAILLEAALDRRRPRTRDLVAVATGALGLAAFLVVAQPGAGVPDASRGAWIAVLASCAGSVAACVLVARWSPEAVRGTMLGVATGVLLGLTAALLKGAVTSFTHDPAEIFTDWHIYALIPIGLAALVLNQNAFQSGPLAAPLTALTLVDPVVSIAIGQAAFHEHVDTSGPRLALEVAAALAMVGGTWLASTIHPRGRSTAPGRAAS